MENHIKIHGIVPRIQYVADGSSTTFEFPFAIFKNENLKVYIGETLQNANTYTISGAGQSDGGSVTFSNTPSSGSVITLFRNIDIERTTDFQEGGALRANALNYELDYQIACQQQIADNVNRAMTFPPYATNTNVDLTLPTPSAGKAIVWNSSGTNLENSTVAVNALESTLLGYKTAAESAASTATIKAGIASDKADVATAKAAEATTTLASKANKDMDNLSATGKAKVANLAMPSASTVDLTWQTTGSYFTAPANGYVTLEVPGNSGQYVSLFNKTSDIISNISLSQNGSIRVWVPAGVGDQIQITYNTSSSPNFFKFVYANGEI